MRSNNYEIIDIGNGVWRGRLMTGYKNDKPVYKEFFALSSDSVRKKLREFEQSMGKRKDSELPESKPKKSAKVISINKKDIVGRDDMLPDQDRKVRIEDIAIVRYVDSEFDRVSFRQKHCNYMLFKNDWEDNLFEDRERTDRNTKMTGRMLCEEWLVNRIKNGARSETIKIESNCCARYILPVIADKVCVDIDRPDIEDMILKALRRQNGELAGCTALATYVRVINSVLEFGYVNDLIPVMFRVRVTVRDENI